MFERITRAFNSTVPNERGPATSTARHTAPVTLYILYEQPRNSFRDECVNSLHSELCGKMPQDVHLERVDEQTFSGRDAKARVYCAISVAQPRAGTVEECATVKTKISTAMSRATSLGVVEGSVLIAVATSAAQRTPIPDLGVWNTAVSSACTVGGPVLFSPAYHSVSPGSNIVTLVNYLAQRAQDIRLSQQSPPIAPVDVTRQRQRADDQHHQTAYDLRGRRAGDRQLQLMVQSEPSRDYEYHSDLARCGLHSQDRKDSAQQLVLTSTDDIAQQTLLRLHNEEQELLNALADISKRLNQVAEERRKILMDAE